MPELRRRPARAAGELGRRAIHIGAGALALLLRWTGALPMALVAVAGIVFNRWLLPRLGGRWLWRPSERRAGRAEGVVLYPVTVLLLIVAFHRRLEVAAAAWGLLAVGDGLGGLAGWAVGGPRLPWNRAKSWTGTVTYAVAGTGAAYGLLLWTAPYPPLAALAACALAAVAGAAIESLPYRVDDNLTAPPLAGLLLLCLLSALGGGGALPELAARVPVAVAVSGAFAGLAWLAGAVSAGGAVVGWVVAAAIYAGLGWRGFLLLTAFVALGTAVTRLGRNRKQAAGLAQEAGGRRAARNVLANGLVASACALFAFLTPESGVFTAACAGALAAAGSDTVASEIGQALRGTTRLITSGRRVAPGTDGGVSLGGTAAGAAGALLLAAAAGGLALVPWPVVPWLALAGLAANGVDSALGATLERRGLIDNEAVNFLATLAGALLAGAAAASALP